VDLEKAIDNNVSYTFVMNLLKHNQTINAEILSKRINKISSLSMMKKNNNTQENTQQKKVKTQDGTQKKKVKISTQDNTQQKKVKTQDNTQHKKYKSPPKVKGSTKVNSFKGSTKAKNN
jgi:predicted RNA-binding protein with RPS1 domain